MFLLVGGGGREVCVIGVGLYYEFVWVFYCIFGFLIVCNILVLVCMSLGSLGVMMGRF